MPPAKQHHPVSDTGFQVFLRSIWRIILGTRWNGSSHLIAGAAPPGSVSEVVRPALPSSDWYLHPSPRPNGSLAHADLPCLGTLCPSLTGPELVYQSHHSLHMILPQSPVGAQTSGSPDPWQAAGPELRLRVFLAQDPRQLSQPPFPHWDDHLRSDPIHSANRWPLEGVSCPQVPDNPGPQPQVIHLPGLNIEIPTSWNLLIVGKLELVVNLHPNFQTPPLPARPPTPSPTAQAGCGETRGLPPPCPSRLLVRPHLLALWHGNPASPPLTATSPWFFLNPLPDPGPLLGGNGGAGEGADVSAQEFCCWLQRGPWDKVWPAGKSSGLCLYLWPFSIFFQP